MTWKTECDGGVRSNQFVDGTYNHFHNILRLFDVLPNFPLIASETCAIITYKHGIYEFPQELPNNLSFINLGNQEISGKCLNLIEY